MTHPFTWQIELKQHTPILHFQGQYASSGATLRATELKPKLDRYIMANLGMTVPSDWKIGSTDALNYKLKIHIHGNAIRCTRNNIPMFFGKGKTPILVDNSSNLEQGDVTLEFFCLNESLRKCLSEIDWNNFFLVTNFGTRQSKGYGSFFPIIKAIDPTSLVGLEIMADDDHSYRIDSFFSPDYGDQTVTWNDIMDCISDVYKCLRSGINEKGLYFKSLMFAYAKQHGQWWDKRTIKELWFPAKLEEHRQKHRSRTNPDPLAEQPIIVQGQTPYPMFRDNLGLSTIERWDDYGITVKRTSGSIKRFKSPILFKPMMSGGRWYVFLLHREIPQNYKNTTFTVSVNGSNLPFKTYNDFSMSDYMNFVWSIDNYEKYVETEDDEAKDRANGILNDLEEIRANYKK